MKPTKSRLVERAKAGKVRSRRTARSTAVPAVSKEPREIVRPKRIRKPLPRVIKRTPAKTKSTARASRSRTRAVRKPANTLVSQPPPEPPVTVAPSLSAKPTAPEVATPRTRSPRTGARSPAKGRLAATIAGLPVPSILFEGDELVEAALPGKSRKFDLGPDALRMPRASEEGELPASYGTGALLLIPRDPFCLYAHWDFTEQQQRAYNAVSAEGHLVVRLREEATGSLAEEVAVYPESRHWFLHVTRAGLSYVAELGYYDKSRAWKKLSASTAVRTPEARPSEDVSLAFMTLPLDQRPLAAAAEPFRSQGAPEWQEVREICQGLSVSETPEIRDVAPAAPVTQMPGVGFELSPEEEAVLAEMSGVTMIRFLQAGSLEIEELVRQGRALGIVPAPQAGLRKEQLPAEAISSAVPPAFGISSPAQVPGPAQESFWFNINAELVIYGATEPDATVTIGGRRIRLRPDGTFSYRFALPDGAYDLMAKAESHSGDTRQAALEFERRTTYSGEVGPHPQAASLKPPRAENIS